MSTKEENGKDAFEDNEESREPKMTWTEEEKRAFLENLNELDRGQYAAYVRDVAVEKVREVLIAPLVDALSAEQKRIELVFTSLKYRDFWNYRERMIEISNKNPGFGAEQVYRLAKKESLERDEHICRSS